MTLEKLFLEYDAKRSRSERIAQHKRQTLMERDPALAVLMEEKNEICLEQLRETLQRPADRKAIAAAAQQQLDQLDRRIAALDVSAQLRQIVPQYECPICKDTGYDDRSSARVLCPCLLKRVYAEIYGGTPLSALNGSFEAYDERIFHDAAQQKQARAVKQFAEKYAVDAARKPILLFMGTSGVGKSYTMSCIAKRMDAERVLFIGAFALFQVFHKARLGEALPLEPIFDAEMLLIDDLGTEPMTLNVTREYLFRLLEHRIRKNLPTVISTNMNSAQLKERYTEKVTSRLFAHQTADVLRLTGDDVRLG